MRTAKGGQQESRKRRFWFIGKDAVESYASPGWLTAFYVAAQHSSDLFGRVVEQDKMCDWLENARSGAAEVDLEILFMQMVSEIILLQMKSLGSKASKGAGKGQQDLYMVGGGHGGSVMAGLTRHLQLLMVEEKKALTFRATFTIRSTRSTERKLSRRKVSLVLLIQKMIQIWFLNFCFELKPPVGCLQWSERRHRFEGMKVVTACKGPQSTAFCTETGQMPPRGLDRSFLFESSGFTF